MTETWKPIPDFPDYEASTQGEIRSLKRKVPRVLKPYVNERCHAAVGLCKNGTVHKKWIAQLVLLTFSGPPPIGYTCHHKNNDKSDNRLENLEYALYRTELTEQAIIDIREKRKKGMAGYALSEEYKVPLSTIYAICLGNTYAWCSGPIVKSHEIRGPHRPARISDEDAVKIYHRVKGGETRTAIANELGVNLSTISKIASGKRLATKELAEADKE